jgi:hypothetical protein
MTYEVDSSIGSCLYRGHDLELACDILEHESGAHLQMFPDVSTTQRPTGSGWDRAPLARTASE